MKSKLAIKLWKKGNLIKDVADTVGVSTKAVGGWIKRYELEGPSSLKARERGPETGAHRHLASKQESQLQKLISDKTPDQIELDYALCTRKAVID